MCLNVINEPAIQTCSHYSVCDCKRINDEEKNRGDNCDLLPQEGSDDGGTLCVREVEECVEKRKQTIANEKCFSCNVPNRLPHARILVLNINGVSILQH